ncbi:MAG: PEP-CTERM sorting domain-containing protein [Acidobacteriia bacterium]|nr:PEP-CTERM sorting domain-containing protein [Terriglobia bacterium]
MKWFLPLTLLLVALMSATAFADHIYLVPNDGSGDNFAFVGQFNGHRLVLSGGLTASFFSTEGYLPGSTFGGDTALFLYSTVVWIDGIPTEFFFPPGTLFMTTFALPTDGRDFRVPVEISFSATGINFDTGQTVDLGGGASGHISFSFSNGLYYADKFVQAPEPSTLGFVGTGLIGILASVRKRLRMHSARSLWRIASRT